MFEASPNHNHYNRSPSKLKTSPCKEFTGQQSQVHGANNSPDKMLVQFEKSPLGKASASPKKKAKNVNSSAKKKSKRADENAGEGVSPSKKSSPMKQAALGFGSKSPSKH